MKIIKIEKEHYKGTVYNLEVEEDHSYCTEVIILANCTICETPVNQMARFDVLWDPQKVKI